MPQAVTQGIGDQVWNVIVNAAQNAPVQVYWGKPDPALDAILKMASCPTRVKTAQLMDISGQIWLGDADTPDCT